ncbi:MAG: hypothetical protein V1722_01755 [Candidatus Micrarchaeota archaeon]
MVKNDTEVKQVIKKYGPCAAAVISANRKYDIIAADMINRHGRPAIDVILRHGNRALFAITNHGEAAITAISVHGKLVVDVGHVHSDIYKLIPRTKMALVRDLLQNVKKQGKPALKEWKDRLK